MRPIPITIPAERALERAIDRLRALTVRVQTRFAAATGATRRAARAAGGLASDYWSAPEARPERSDFAVIDLLVLQALAVSSIAAFVCALGTTVSSDLAFAAFGIAFAAIAALAASVLARFAREDPSDSWRAAARASRAPGRRRRILRARLRYVRRIFRRGRAVPRQPLSPLAA